MSKLIVFCNTPLHARKFVAEPLKLAPTEYVAVTPETTEKLYGYMDFEYYELRPAFARELEVARTHGGKPVTLEELKSRKP